MTKELESTGSKKQEARSIEQIVKAVGEAIAGKKDFVAPKPKTFGMLGDERKTQIARDALRQVTTPRPQEKASNASGAGLSHKEATLFAGARDKAATLPELPEALKTLSAPEQLSALANKTENQFVRETVKEAAALLSVEPNKSVVQRLAETVGALKDKGGATGRLMRSIIAEKTARLANALEVNAPQRDQLERAMDMRVRYARTARRPHTSGSSGIENMFSGVDVNAFTDPRDKKWLNELISFCHTNPEDANNYPLLESWVGTLKSRLGHIENPEQQAIAAQALENIYGRMQRMSEDGMIPNTITITEEEAREMENNPIWFLENFAQEIEHEIQKRGFDSPVIEQRLHRYRLISEFFSSDTYDKRMGLDLKNFSNTAGFLKMKEGLLEKKADLLGVYSDRLHVMEFSYALSNVSDFDKDQRFQQLLDRIGDAGAFASRTHWGGLSDVAVNKIRRIHLEILRDPKTAGMKSSLPEVIALATKRASKELLEEKELWSIQYRHYLHKLVEGSEEYIKLPSDIDEMMLDERSCDAIARIASGSYTMFFEKQEVMNSGSPPAVRGLLEGINQFVTANSEEKMLAIFRMRDWFYRKWTNLIGGQKAVWNERAMYYVHKDKELQEWAREKKNKLWDELKEWKKIDKDKKNEKIAHPLFNKMKTIFSEYENHLEIDSDDKFIHFLSGLKSDKLYHYVACDIGGEWAQMHGAKPYGFWGSGVRRNVIYRAIQDSLKYKSLVNPIDSSEEDPFLRNKLFMGRDVLDAANGHFHPNAHRRSERKRSAFIKVLDNALKYHPHVFMKLRADELKLGMGDVQGMRFSEATRRFGVIQSELMFRAFAPIDYSQGFASLSVAQRSVVDDVFLKTTKGFSLSKDEYFAFMRGCVAELEGHMEDFAHVRYGSKFAFLLWTDDVPMPALQMPELARAFESMTDEEKKDLGRDTPLSRQIVEGGRGRHGLWRRAWGDFIMASTLLPAQINTLTNDEKKFTESIVQLASVIPQYQTHADGAVAVLEASAGFLGAAKVKGGYGEFLKWMKNSSIMKEFWSDESLSLELGEASHMYEKFQNLIGKLRLQSPAYAEAIDSYLGITNWRPIVDLVRAPLVKVFGEEKYDQIVEMLNENAPNALYTQKILNTLPFALLVIMLFAIDQAKKGGQDAKN